MITKTKAFVSSDGKTFTDENEAKAHELFLIMTDQITALDATSTVQFEATAQNLVRRGDEVGLILGIKRKRAKSTSTPKPSSKKAKGEKAPALN